MYKTRLNHTILFFKGWYKCIDPYSNEEEYWYKTLKRTLALDGYYFCNKQNIISILFNELDNFNKYRIKNGISPVSFYSFNDEFQSYMLFDNLSYFLAIVKTIKNILGYTTCIEISKPFFNKELRKKYHLIYGNFEQGMTYKYINTYRVKRIFNE